MCVVSACGSNNEPQATTTSADAKTSTTTAPSDGSTTTTVGSTTTTSPQIRPIGDLASANVTITKQVAITLPTATAIRPSDPTALYVASQTGLVSRIGSDDQVATSVDLTKLTAAKGERGLLGLAFSLDGATMYVNYTNTKGNTVIASLASAANNTFSSSSLNILMTIDQPYENHNGGAIKVLNDGTLLIGTGDGGSAGDPENRGQDPLSLLGKLLRIDPSTPANGKKYSIPLDNPYASNTRYLPEIWSIGLRNPWKLDVIDGSLFIADVGQDKYEEVNIISFTESRGANFGWALREGNAKYKGNRPDSNVDPVYVYSHDNNNCSISGGAIANDPASPATRGHYVFLDYCVGKLTALDASQGFTQAVDLNVTIKRASGVERGPQGQIVILGLAANTLTFVG